MAHHDEPTHQAARQVVIGYVEDGRNLMTAMAVVGGHGGVPAECAA